MRHLVYGLRDPRTGEIRYVGKSNRGLARPRAHRLPSYLKVDTHKTRWIRKLRALSLDYETVVLEVLPSADGLDEAERRWIAIGRSALGGRLTNATDGGEGHNHLSSATREKITAALRGRPWSAEHRAKNAVVNRGRKLTDEHKAKVAEAMRRRRLSPEHRARIAASRIGRKFPRKPLLSEATADG